MLRYVCVDGPRLDMRWTRRTNLDHKQSRPFATQLLMGLGSLAGLPRLDTTPGIEPIEGRLACKKESGSLTEEKHSNHPLDAVMTRIHR